MQCSESDQNSSIGHLTLWSKLILLTADQISLAAVHICCAGYDIRLSSSGISSQRYCGGYWNDCQLGESLYRVATHIVSCLCDVITIQIPNIKAVNK
jgi:hypothetical protein